MDRETLLRQPPGWLARWAAQLERDHCTAPGAGTDLAVQVADSLPLDPHASLRLLYPGVQVGEVMLDSNSGIRLNTPLWRIPGVGLVAEGPYEVSGRDSSLMLTAKSTDNLIGVETVMYLVKPRAAGPGFTLAPIYADRLIDGVTERRPKPTNDILQFASEVSFYEVFYKSWANDFTAILVGARTPAELDHAVQQLKTNPGASCATLKNKTCIALPKDYGLTLLVSVTVNGSQQFLSRGATVFNAIRSSGENQPDRVLPQLRILRQWNGRPIPVAFDPSDRTILNLPLRGGETISWR